MRTKGSSSACETKILVPDIEDISLSIEEKMSQDAAVSFSALFSSHMFAHCLEKTHNPPPRHSAVYKTEAWLCYGTTV